MTESIAYLRLAVAGLNNNIQQAPSKIPAGLDPIFEDLLPAPEGLIAIKENEVNLLHTIMHILIAPNAFKNSLDALAVAEAIGEGLHQSKLNCSFEYFPVGDGGDGTAALIIQKNNGTIINAEVHDALGRNIHASFGLIDNGNTAVIELADASGIRLLQPQELDPLHATTYGTGELIKHALDKGVSKIIMCIGGSATVDGGTGILQALGIRFLNDKNEILKGLPEPCSSCCN